MVTRPASLDSVVDDPYILLCSEKITKVQQLMPLLDKIMRARAPLIIIAENVEGTALSMLVHNHVNGIFQCVAVRAPGFGDRRLHKLEDIATLTGGAVYSKHSGFTLETMAAEQLGRARQVRVTADHTTIIGGHGSSEAIAFRVDQLRAERERAQFGIDEDVLTERIGSLSGKVAVIRVGAATNAELSELRHRVEDALSATRAAMAEGIVAGGGATLLHAVSALDDLQVTGDYAIGVGIVRRALSEPAHLIAANAGDDAARWWPDHSAGRGRRVRRLAGPSRQHDRWALSTRCAWSARRWRTARRRRPAARRPTRWSRRSRRRGAAARRR